MKKLLSYLLIIVCASCQGQSNSFHNAITDPGQIDVFLIIGNSIASGLTGHTASTLPAAGTAFEYDRTTANILNFGDGAGVTGFSFNSKSPWAKFCIDYYTDTGIRPLIINRGASASTISPALSGLVDNDWQTSGDNYTPAVSAARDALAKTGQSSLKAIIIDLGINDVQGQSGTGSFTVAQVQGYLDDLIDNLNTDFGSTTPILLIIPGRYTGDDVSTRLTGIRNAVKTRAVTYSNVYVCASLTSFAGAGLLDDGIHPDGPDGNDALGSMVARWFKNSAYNKWARAIIGSHFDEISSGYKTTINNWITANESLYLAMDMLYVFNTTTKNNTFLDWTFLNGPGSDGGFTFNANSDIRTTSTSTLFHLGYNQNETAINVLTNDYGVGVNPSVITTASLTTAGIIGSITTGPTKATLLRQLNTGGVNYAVLSSTSYTDAGETNLTATPWMIEKPSSGTIQLRKNGTIVDSQSDTSLGASVGDWSLGAVRTNGTLGQPIDANFKWFTLYKPSLISNYTTFISDLNGLHP